MLTPWPPGPEEREKRQLSAAAGTTTEPVTGRSPDGSSVAAMRTVSRRWTSRAPGQGARFEVLRRPAGDGVLPLGPLGGVHAAQDPAPGQRPLQRPDPQREVDLLAELGRRAVGAPRLEVGVAQPQQDGVAVRHVQRPRRHPQRDQQAEERMGDRRVAPVEEAVPAVADEDVGVVQVVVLQRGRDAAVRQPRAQPRRSGPRSATSRSRTSTSARPADRAAARRRPRAGRRPGRAAGRAGGRARRGRPSRRRAAPGRAAAGRSRASIASHASTDAGPPAARRVGPPSGSSISRRSRCTASGDEHVLGHPLPQRGGERRLLRRPGPTDFSHTAPPRTGSRNAVDHGRTCGCSGSPSSARPRSASRCAAHSRAPARQAGSSRSRRRSCRSPVLTRRR